MAQPRAAKTLFGNDEMEVNGLADQLLSMASTKISDMFASSTKRIQDKVTDLQVATLKSAQKAIGIEIKSEYTESLAKKIRDREERKTNELMQKQIGKQLDANRAEHQLKKAYYEEQIKRATGNTELQEQLEGTMESELTRLDKALADLTRPYILGMDNRLVNNRDYINWSDTGVKSYTEFGRDAIDSTSGQDGIIESGYDSIDDTSDNQSPTISRPNASNGQVLSQNISYQDPASQIMSPATIAQDIRQEQMSKELDEAKDEQHQLEREEETDEFREELLSLTQKQLDFQKKQLEQLEKDREGQDDGIGGLLDLLGSKGGKSALGKVGNFLKIGGGTAVAGIMAAANGLAEGYNAYNDTENIAEETGKIDGEEISFFDRAKNSVKGFASGVVGSIGDLAGTAAGLVNDDWGNTISDTIGSKGVKRGLDALDRGMQSVTNAALGKGFKNDRELLAEEKGFDSWEAYKSHIEEKKRLEAEAYRQGTDITAELEQERSTLVAQADSISSVKPKSVTDELTEQYYAQYHPEADGNELDSLELADAEPSSSPTIINNQTTNTMVMPEQPRFRISDQSTMLLAMQGV